VIVFIRRHPKGILSVLVLLSALLLARPALTHLRAAGLLLRIQDPNQRGVLATRSTYPVEESPTEVATPFGSIPARLYIPKGADNAPGMVIVHGVHHLGIEEPRLVRFARAMSASGMRVLTPELAALADYRVDSQSVTLIGYSARRLSSDVGQKVGVLGLSFAGGLSLIAAVDPQYEPYIRLVISVAPMMTWNGSRGFSSRTRLPALTVQPCKWWRMSMAHWS